MKTSIQTLLEESNKAASKQANKQANGRPHKPGVFATDTCIVIVRLLFPFRGL